MIIVELEKINASRRMSKPWKRTRYVEKVKQKRKKLRMAPNISSLNC